MTYSVEVRQRAFTLLGQGWSPRQVGLELGVSRVGVSLWRRQVGGVIRERPALSARYLSRAERYELARLHDAGHGVREIGRRLGRSASTISRELARPRRPSGARGRPAGRGVGYAPEACHQAAAAARTRARTSKLSRQPALQAWVQARLDERYSPAQIAGRLRVEHPDDEQMRISHETIYRAIYIRPRGELKRELRAHLRTGRELRRRRATRQTQQTRGRIVDAVSISERPDDVETRLVPGDYEGDLMLGPTGTTAAIGTLVERTSGHLTAFLLPERHTADATLAGLLDAVTRTGWPMRTLTWDRGHEMARHAQFSIATGIQVYFADPHAPWQRGSNENTNGLLREYFPRGRDLATATDAELQAAVDQLNNRPRQRHDFLNPNEVLTAILDQDQQTAGVATTD
ncbi:IS30-like element ISCg2 family transposase [Microlunatus spumicola]|uniref:IS30-like element ISCg2 family transposase n=1 Tax=Microlunatus spumicola TaxID=81499 RepID=A0ABP6WNG5_9ACTN